LFLLNISIPINNCCASTYFSLLPRQTF